MSLLPGVLALGCAVHDLDGGDTGEGGGGSMLADRGPQATGEADRVVEHARALAASAGAPEILDAGVHALPAGQEIDARLDRTPASGLVLSDISGRFVASARLLGASPTPFADASGLAVAPHAGPDGAHVISRVDARGVEDLLLFERSPVAPAIDYELRLERGIAGLRLVDRTLELLDDEGTPRFRIAPPWLVDARGQRVPADLELGGCAFDASPSAPWGRAITRPGASACTVTVAWRPEGLEAPLLLDPFWTSTASMATGRAGHTATLLGTGKVLVAGGTTSGGAISSAELYDPVTGTWAMTGNMGAPGRTIHTASLLQSGLVLVASGYDGSSNITSAIRYTAASGTWSPAGTMLQGRRYHAANVLGSGKVLVAGGSQYVSGFDPCAITSAELYDPATNSWSAAASMAAERSAHTSTTLLNGRVLVTGGQSFGCGISDTSETYDPTSNTWSSSGIMSDSRYYHGAARLPSGQVIVAGGTVASQTGVNVDIFTPSGPSGSWGLTGNLIGYREHHATSVLSTGSVLVTGGDSGVVLKSTEVFDAAAGAWFSVGDLVSARQRHTSTALPNGSALIVGGVSQAQVYLATAERLTLAATGAACGATAQCQPALTCADGVCCGSACSGGCEACSVVSGASADGTCSPLPLGDPGAPACTGGYVCNGSVGACPATCSNDTGCAATSHCAANGTCKADLATGQACTSPTQCLSASCVEGVCCATPCTGTCQACKASNKVSGADGICGTAKLGLDPHDDCADDGAPSCQKDGTCDGAGACKLYAEGTECGPPSCGATELTETTCNGSGACLPSVTDCGTYACHAAACETTCSGDDDCASDAYCDAGACAAKTAGGAACREGAECVTGLCVDGVCCNAPCDGQCEACDVQGAEGTCIPVTGEPHGSRPPCSKGSADDPCSAATCDGIERKTCAAFVGSSKVCRPGTCEAGIGTLAATCDGLGHCPLETKPCEPFACDGDACATSCDDDTQCAAAYRCQNGACVSSAACKEDGTLVAADGTITVCAPYACVDRACKTSCESVADCIAPSACGSDGKCVEAATAEAASGCATKAPGSGTGGMGALAALVGLALIAARRRLTIAFSAGGLLACSAPPREQVPAPTASPAAAAAVERVRAFEIPAPPSHPGMRDLGHDADRHLVGAGLVRRLDPHGERLLAALADEAALDRSGARVEVGARADAPFRVEDAGTGIWLETTLRGASRCEAELSDGLVVYPGGGPRGADVVHRVTPDGTEDVVVLHEPLDTAELLYEVRIGGGAAGVRFVGDAFEVLDAGGAPRLHAGRPFLVDARGTMRAGRVDVDGCEVDRDPAEPWGRAPTPPGGEPCVLRVSWSDEGLTYPVAVDPPWTVTANLLGARAFHGSALLQSGKVLIAGGSNGLSIPWTDLWDPATGTWAAAPSMGSARTDLVVVKLNDGRVLAAGGQIWGGGTLDTAEVYQPNGSWSPTGSMNVPRFLASGVLLGSGKVLAAGGFSAGATADTYDPVLGTWSLTGPMNSSRVYHASALLTNGRVMLVGGHAPGLTASATLYDPATNAWTATTPMATARLDHAASTLANGKVLVTGGFNPGSGTLVSAELYEPSNQSWSPTGSLIAFRERHVSVTLPSGRILVAAGYGGFFKTLSEIYDPVLGQFSQGGNMNAGRQQHTTTLLANGSVLMTGGNVGNYIANCEVFTLGSPGLACPSTQACQPGLTCTDGFCCNQPCAGACEVCAQSMGATANGACTTLPAGNVGTPSCAPYLCSGMSAGCPSTCASDAGCAGTAHCSGATCKNDLAIGGSCTSAAQCQSGQCVEGVCCDSPCTGTCQACKATNKVAGADGACGLAKDGLDPHDDCNDDGVASCNHDGACDGAGSCRSYPAGTACLGVCSASTALAGTCNGSGSCAVTQSECAPFACDAGACASMCASGADCTVGAWCDGTTCALQSEVGAQCAADDECKSGVCADGLCCDIACDGQCEACDVRGAEGLCVPVSGVPHAGHRACDAGSASEPCAAQACDGIVRDSCAGWVGSTVLCREATCVDGASTVAALCDGEGHCPEATVIACTPFTCGRDGCLETCGMEADCADGYACVNGKCLAGATCDGHVVTAQNGETKNCAPYKCEPSGACKPSCASIVDCAPGYACTQGGECIPKGQATAGQDQGGCAAAGRSGAPGRWAPMMVLAVLALSGARRRRWRRVDA